jgi:hypothetical protein
VEPFNQYPGGGRAPLGRPKRTDNCRYGYSLELQRRTGQTRCAYCAVSLVDDYYHWLLLSVDHVVPRGEALRLGIPAEYTEDFFNLVLCCAGCNGFANRYVVPPTPESALPVWGLDRFLELRDRVFADRSRRIAERRAAEQAFFDSRPWITPTRCSARADNT